MLTDVTTDMVITKEEIFSPLYPFEKSGIGGLGPLV